MKLIKKSSNLRTNVLYNEDCLTGMKRLPDKSIDMVLCDLPYGTTALSWDKVINLNTLWEEYERIIKDNKKYKRIYLKYLESSNNTPKPALAFTLNTETGVITSPDADLIIEQIRFDFIETEFDETNILICR